MKFRTIAQLHKELKSKIITTSEVLNASYQRIKEIENLNAYVTLVSESANHAQLSQNYFKKEKPRSLLEGIPIAVKDNFCVENVRTTCGSKMLKNFKPKYTATVVEKLLKSGAIIIGKTNLDEFAMGSGTIESLYGPTKNIWGSRHTKNGKVNIEEADWYISGGSSGGSAVAVASRTCLGAIGSDTGGSTRNPASYCGVVGLKPTYGLLSRHGLIPLVNSMDVPGILTNYVEDAFILLKTMAGHDVKDSTTVDYITVSGELESESVVGLKVGVPMEYNCVGLSDEVKSTWQLVAELLEKGGAEIIPISMPYTKYSIICYSILNSCEVASNMAKYDGVEFGNRGENKLSIEQMYAETRTKNFNSIVQRRILTGNYFLLENNYEKYFVKAMKIRRLIANDFLHAWKSGCNVLLTPTTLTVAPENSAFIKQDEREQCAREDYCTQPANMSGCPAVSVPIKLSEKGLPISIQLMAPNFKDKKMLEVAHFIEKEVQFDRLRDEYC